MKKILVLILTLTLTSTSFAQLKGKLSFFSQEGDKFWVILNGEKINKEPAYSVKDINVSFDYGSVRIIFENSKIPTIDKNVQVVDVENNLCHVLYMIKKDKKGKYVIRDIDATWEVLGPKGGVTTTTTTTTVPANSNVTTSTTVNQPSQTNQNTQTVNQTSTTSTNTGDQQNMNMGFGINVTETPDGVDMNVNMGGVNVNTSASGNNNGMNSSTNMNVGGVNTSSTSSTTVTTTTTTTSSNISNTQNKPNTQIQQHPVEQHQQPAYVLPGYSGPTGCAMPMSNESFNTAKTSISGKSFEDSKMTIAKQVVGNNCLLCSQVKEIMVLFSFEDTKLEFAKFAYKHTFDIGNYYQLNDAFNFESTIEELNEYITNNK